MSAPNHPSETEVLRAFSVALARGNQPMVSELARLYPFLRAVRSEQSESEKAGEPETADAAPTCRHPGKHCGYPAVVEVTAGGPLEVPDWLPMCRFHLEYWLQLPTSGAETTVGVRRIGGGR